jgi:hypothetical protein
VKVSFKKEFPLTCPICHGGENGGVAAMLKQ